MGFVQSRFGQGYNGRHRSTGPLWQSRFRAKSVQDEGYLLQLIAYIHLNPVTAKVASDPAEYRRSGHAELLKKTTSALIDTEQTLSLYGETLRSARRAYVRTLQQVDEATWRMSLPGALPWLRPQRDRPLEPPPPAAWIDERGLSTGRDRPRVTAAEFLEHCAELLDISVGQLAVRRQDRETSRLRYLVAGLGIERWRHGPAALARSEAVGRWAQRAGELRLRDEAFRAAYESLDARFATVLVEQP